MSETSACGWCAGITVETPAGKTNAPGRGAIAYRVGDWGSFKASLLARLSDSDFPSLSALTTRDQSDYTIALCDAFAMLADVVTFYQERIANENYLRTATQFNSVLQLAALVGYQPTPGAAANASLAFSMQSTPGQPALAPQPSPIPIGTRVQSMPDPNQVPQTFETVGAITARLEWNAMAAQTSEAVPIQPGLKELYLAGTATQLSQGDALLLLGIERESPGNTSDRWDVCWIETVTTDATNNLTHVTWTHGLRHVWRAASLYGVKVFALRQRAALFGNNAPDPRLMNLQNAGGLVDASGNWANFVINKTGERVDLDAAYPKIAHGSWLVLAGGWEDFKAVYRVVRASLTSRTDFGLSGRITRLQFDTKDGLEHFGLRETQVLAQSDELAQANRPLTYPVYGSTLVLGSVQTGLAPGQLLGVSGKRQRVMLGPNVTDVEFPNAGAHRPTAGDSFVLLAAPEIQVGGALQALRPEQLDPAKLPSSRLAWTLLDRDGATITAQAPATSFQLQPALSSDPVVSEATAIVAGTDGVVPGLDTTTLQLVAPLTYCYDRSTVAVNANVAPATAGLTVAEIGGGGDASQANQSFTLKQSPLTYVLDPNSPTGSSPTMTAQVSGLTWTPVPSLFDAGPQDRVYALSQGGDGSTTVRFGDGIKGARLPTGQNNVRFSYRQGLGTAGNLRAGQISMLLTRPAGVTSATNPSPSTGGQDPEAIDDARGNAPFHLLTLDRAVSTQDYADFAATYAGIAKAYSVWIGSGPARGIHVTIAGPGGSTFEPTDATVKALGQSLRQFGDARLPITVQSFGKPTFTLAATVKVADDADPAVVLPAVVAVLRGRYAFATTEFGAPITLDGVYATMQAVSGVVAVSISRLYRIDTGPLTNEPSVRLLAQLPSVQPDGSVSPAELLTLDPGPLQIGAMP
jgi:hypothetical protein